MAPRSKEDKRLKHLQCFLGPFHGVNLIRLIKKFLKALVDQEYLAVLLKI